MRGILGGRKEGRLDGLSVIVYTATAGVGTVCGGWGGSQVYCLWRGDITFFRGDHQVFVDRVEEGVKVEVRFRGSKGDKGG